MHAAWFHRLAHRASAAMGSLAAFVATLVFVGASVMLGPWLGWMMVQVIHTTVLTVVTQLTAMLIQTSTERQEDALQRKLDEIIKALPQADNRLRGIEKQDACHR